MTLGWAKPTEPKKLQTSGSGFVLREAVGEARTPNEVRLARFLLREQEEIALELNLGYLSRHNSDRY